MFISPAYAQAGGAGSDPLFSTLIMIGLMFAIFYFLLIRPQQRKAKEHRGKLGAIKRGDRVLTGGGIFGTVTKAGAESGELTVEIADGVKVTVARATVSDVLTKGAAAAKAGGKRQPATEDKPKGLLQGLLGGRK